MENIIENYKSQMEMVNTQMLQGLRLIEAIEKMMIKNPVERWVLVSGYSNYTVSSLGRCKNVATGKMLGSSTDGRYILVGLRNNKSCKCVLLHRLIYETFKGIIPQKCVIDHIDFDKFNNSLTNLQCITQNENNKRSECNRQKFHEKAKIAHQLKRDIKSFHIDGSTQIFKSKSEASRFYKCSPALIYLIVEKKNRAKSANTEFGKVVFTYA